MGGVPDFLCLLECSLTCIGSKNIKKGDADGFLEGFIGSFKCYS